MAPSTPLVTAEELERLPRDDRRYELVEGRLIPMSPVGLPHGTVVANVIFLLRRHLLTMPVAQVMTEVGFKLAANPDTVRAPDIAVVRKDRLSPNTHGFPSLAPDLAIEVLSPDDRPGEVRSKVDEYLARGVLIVVVIDPETRTATVWRASGSPIRLDNADDRLDLDEVLPGFSCSLDEIFD